MDRGLPLLLPQQHPGTLTLWNNRHREDKRENTKTFTVYGFTSLKWSILFYYILFAFFYYASWSRLICQICSKLWEPPGLMPQQCGQFTVISSEAQSVYVARTQLGNISVTDEEANRIIERKHRRSGWWKNITHSDKSQKYSYCPHSALQGSWSGADGRTNLHTKAGN